MQWPFRLFFNHFKIKFCCIVQLNFSATGFFLKLIAGWGGLPFPPPLTPSYSPLLLWNTGIWLVVWGGGWPILILSAMRGRGEVDRKKEGGWKTTTRRGGGWPQGSVEHDRHEGWRMTARKGGGWPQEWVEDDCRRGTGAFVWEGQDAWRKSAMTHEKDRKTARSRVGVTAWRGDAKKKMWHVPSSAYSIVETGWVRESKCIY